MHPEMPVRVLSTTRHSHLFKLAHANDVGYDLPLLIDNPSGCQTLQHGVTYDLSTGISILMSRDIGARIVSRSSTFFRLGIEVYEGLIDPGYTGELKIIVTNRTGVPVTLHDGQRIAQVVFFPVVRPILVAVSEFPDVQHGYSHRGSDGFGSTGK